VQEPSLAVELKEVFVLESFEVQEEQQIVAVEEEQQIVEGSQVLLELADRLWVEQEEVQIAE
jgi:hypothetical protein